MSSERMMVELIAEAIAGNNAKRFRPHEDDPTEVMDRDGVWRGLISEQGKAEVAQMVMDFADHGSVSDDLIDKIVLELEYYFKPLKF